MKNFDMPISLIPRLQIAMTAVAIVAASLFGIGAAMSLPPGTHDFSDFGFDVSELIDSESEAEATEVRCRACGIVEWRRRIVHDHKMNRPPAREQASERRLEHPSVRGYESAPPAIR